MSTNPRTQLCEAFARAGFHAAQSSLADIALDWMRGYLARADVVERAAKAYCAAYCVQLRRWNPAGFSARCEQCEEWVNVVELSKAALNSILEDTP